MPMLRAAPRRRAARSAWASARQLGERLAHGRVKVLHPSGVMPPRSPMPHRRNLSLPSSHLAAGLPDRLGPSRRDRGADRLGRARARRRWPTRRSPASHPWSASTRRRGARSSMRSSAARSTWWSGRWPRPQRSPRRRWRPRRARARTQFLSLTIALALVVGVIALVAGLLRLGFLASFISEPVLKGFIIGLALTIIVGQLPKLFGVEKGDGDFFEQLWDLLRELGNTSGLTLLVGLLSLGLVVLLKERAPAIPGSLAAVLLGIARGRSLRPRPARRRNRRQHRGWAPVTRPSGRGARRLPRPWRRRVRRDVRRLRRGRRSGQDLRGPSSATRSIRAAS